MMKALHTGRISGLSILAGLIAGRILVGLNMVVVQPFMRALANIEIENLLAEGRLMGINSICNYSQSIILLSSIVP
jgi:hypothetical protein